MPTRIRVLGGALLAAFAGLAVAACDDATGPEGSGAFELRLAAMQGGASSAVLTDLAAVDARLASVDLEDVETIEVDVDRIEVHRRGDDDGEDEAGEGENGEDDGEPGGWISLDTELGTLELLGLPVGDGLTVATSEGLPAGDYDGVRFFFTDARITFANPIEVPGPGDDIPAGEAVSLRIPSGEQTGVKVPGASFTVSDGGGTEVTILFDTGTSVRNVTVTGTGEVIMAPVLAPGDGADDDEEPDQT